MGEVIQLTRSSPVEFEREALRKLGALAEMMLKVPDLLAVLDEEPVPGAERQAAHGFVQLMSILDHALEQLDGMAPDFIDMPQKWQAIFELECQITNLRVRAFATARCSILYVNDFELDGLNEAFEKLGEHRRRLLPPPVISGG